MKSMSDPESEHRPNPLARWGPLIAIAVVVVVVGALIITGGGGDDEETADSTSSTVDPAEAELPENVLPFSVAEARGEVDDIDWGPRCDTTEGVLAMPLTPPPECFAPYDGPGG
ncbi:MAG: hypothetical protein ACK4V6_13035, partial [Microthrixaceae bacterium]